ncbi:30S ribosomal protein S21 [Candidatus Woesebacteria bacterium]|nr:30S ribosomal protein S21 [Candidatus Woesebacteria bacterium]MCD8507345.1 30S ribosomal protein S21 [Candidatus Woesebacteria bacterium]MCD8526983.1 30S ribosomal protein S21 [Candidatus Woesebacteria bacterium]MCD8546778.1 30S ribosomal protein S21 [Candidatus Woesebacteria bacterium]
MPIIVKASKGDDNHGLIKKFKKASQSHDDVVTQVRDRRYHKPPALLRKEAKKELERKLKAERRIQRRRQQG